MEDVEIDAARPQHDVREVVFFEVAFDHRRGRHHRERRLVEPVQELVGCGNRNAEARLHILRKARVIRRGERQLVLDRVCAGGHAERAFSGDVQRIRRERADALAQLALREQRQANLRIGRARNRLEFERRQQVDAVAQRGQLARGVFQRAYHAIDLRFPCIGDDHDLHRL